MFLFLNRMGPWETITVESGEFLKDAPAGSRFNTMWVLKNIHPHVEVNGVRMKDIPDIGPVTIRLPVKVSIYGIVPFSPRSTVLPIRAGKLVRLGRIQGHCSQCSQSDRIGFEVELTDEELDPCPNLKYCKDGGNWYMVLP